MASPRYRFRNFLLDPAARELRCGDTLVSLPASGLDALIHLVEHRDRAVDRDELITAIWDRADVADNLLAQTILKVRRALGQTGSDGAIRTVARFGYRWVEPTWLDNEPADDPEPAATITEVDAAAGLPQARPTPLTEPALAARPPTRRRPLTGYAWLILSLILVALAGWAIYPLLTTPPDAKAPVADTIDLHLPIHVLPARVPESRGWEWLRLGLMDVIGNRLRQGGLPVATSEQVLASLAVPDAPDHSATDHWRVQPEANHHGGKWRLTLHAAAPDGTTHEVAAEADDVLDAARLASDQLMIFAGRTPPAHTGSPRPLALEELLQRTRAAILSDQFDLALSLIEQAPEALRANPEIELRLAQIEQGRGDDNHASARLTALLGRLTADTDPSVHGRIMTSLGASQFRLGELTQARQTFTQAIEQLERAPDPIGLAAAYGSRAAVALLHEDFAAATADLGKARVEMEAGGDRLGLAQIDTSLGLAQVMDYRPAVGLPLLLAAEQRIAGLGAREELAHVRYAQIGAQLQLLDHDAAQQTVARFWPPDAHTGNPRMRMRLMLARTRVLLAVGELGQATTLLNEIENNASPEADTEVLAEARAVAVLLLAAGHRNSETIGKAGALLASGLERQHADLYVAVWTASLRSLRELGRWQEARSGTDALRTWVVARNNRWRQLHTRLAEAEQAWAENDRPRAMAGFAESFENAQQLAIPDDLAMVAELYVQALIAEGDLDRAASVIGTVAGWADQDARIAWAQALLYRTQGRVGAWERSTTQALRLARERPLPFVRLQPGN